MGKTTKGVPEDSLGILNIVRTCQNFHTLPRAGGLLDQDALFVEIIYRITQYENARAELDRKLEQAKTG